MKNYLLIFTLLISLQLIAEDVATGEIPAGEFGRFLPNTLQATNIVDFVYSDSVLDGDICFSQNDQEFVINNWMYDFQVGDSGGVIVDPDPNSFIRGFISFDLPVIPEEYIIDSVFVRLYQYFSIGDGYTNDFPNWNVAGGDTIKCIMSHINYGDELDEEDWEKGDFGNPFTFNHNVGVVTDSPAEGYRYIDVTDCVIADYETGRSRSQYRIAFGNIDTDWDGESDLVAFVTSSAHEDYHLMPTLYINSSSPANNNDAEVVKPKSTINNFPNPFNPLTQLSYEINEPSKVTVEIFNIRGQHIETLVDEYQSKGKYSVTWNAIQESSGIYFYRLTAGNQSQTGKCVLLK